MLSMVRDSSMHSVSVLSVGMLTRALLSVIIAYRKHSYAQYVSMVSAGTLGGLTPVRLKTNRAGNVVSHGRGKNYLVTRAPSIHRIKKWRSIVQN